MVVLNKKEPLLVFTGDIIIFAISLWLSISLRNGGFSSLKDLGDYLIPFSILFALWSLVFFIAGLYDKYTTILRDRLPGMIFWAQVTNSIIAFGFFYLIPFFGIAPKTILLIDLVISFVLIYYWRAYSNFLFGFKHKELALIVGRGEEMKDLEREVNDNFRSGLSFVDSIDLDTVESGDLSKEIVNKISSKNVSVVAIDLRNEKVEPIVPQLYNFIFSGIKFVDMYKIYEDVFDRIPLSLIRYNWFLENISVTPRVVYDILKRISDVLLAVILGFIFLIFLPFVYLVIKIEDRGPVFFVQNRIGRNNKIIKLLKFRSMSVVEKEKITKVGWYLRKTRIDELPQFWNVLKGDLSLIGPRPETPELAKSYESDISYYNIRHLIKPGLSGWAQIYQNNPPKFSVNLNDTKIKLSYDIYYVKNRSIMLDIKIALKTIKTILSKSGK
jgi:lipopolysaccharide/colanic/teichoic acid biosynthesis glycosyltransferase